ncbi:hypothetical protein K470DRAFT_264117 [Piedraia hortae CBS 480.64]|uniref:Uncharacterized protein n=1 Tax=Piedraia hortae CBS 480.64 TaxID=1314780 RepID=A0A6A7C1W8_9PEZI|nr:hypothetical protein K470DRAFT_264117 [Piedraia hortae CBS 480.64]
MDRGKRDSSEDVDDAIRASFKRAYEAKFRPLPKEVRETRPEIVEQPVEDDVDDGEEWEGFSEDDQVEVVLHDAPRQYEAVDRRDTKEAKPSSTMASVETDDEERANLRNDLELQRLLKEAHLLDPLTFGNGAVGDRPGKIRLKAVDLRLQELGARSEQEKMPMQHRKGIIAKKDQREIKRRKEAKENGVILERLQKTKTKQRKRERGIGVPSVGKFRGGTLKLSSNDIRSIHRH